MTPPTTFGLPITPAAAVGALLAAPLFGAMLVLGMAVLP